ncbi:MAG: hypothetical protein ACKVZH_17190 [Blastocatellia bacterium]
MKRSGIIFAFAIWLALTLGAQAQTPTSETQQQAAINRQLLTEIKSLRRELLQQAVEFQQWKLDQITRDLQQAQTEQQRLFHEEQLVQQEINELAAASDGQSELETLRSELSGERTQKLRIRQQPLAERVNTLTEQVQKEEKRLRQLADKLKNN